MPETRFIWIRANKVRSWMDFQNEVNVALKGKKFIQAVTVSGGTGLGIFYEDN